MEIRYLIYITISFIVATIIGIFGQGMAYFLHDMFQSIAPVSFLVVLTFISVGLYIMIPVLIYLMTDFNKHDRRFYFISLMTSLFIGIPVSVWSIFVLVMWLG